MYVINLIRFQQHLLIYIHFQTKYNQENSTQISFYKETDLKIKETNLKTKVNKSVNFFCKNLSKNYLKTLCLQPFFIEDFESKTDLELP